MHRNVIVSTAIIVLVATVSMSGFWYWRSAISLEQAEHLASGQQLYVDNCAACHGEALEGQPDWRTRLPSDRMPAPPHDETGHTWHHSDEQLFLITRDGIATVVGGNYESDMPGFGDLLTDDEIRAILDYIKSTWPERERAYQAQMSNRDDG